MAQTSLKLPENDQEFQRFVSSNLFELLWVDVTFSSMLNAAESYLRIHFNRLRNQRTTHTKEIHLARTDACEEILFPLNTIFCLDLK